MNCSTIEKEIIPYHYGELSPQEREAFDRHVQLCPHCARFSYEMARAAEYATRAVTLKEGADLWPKLKRRIEAREPLSSRYRFAFVPAVAVLVLVVAITSTFIRSLPRMHPGETEIVANYEMLTDYEILEDLEALESMGPVGSERV